MLENFSLYDFAKDLSLVGWILITLILAASVYVLSRIVERFVAKTCPFCAERIQKSATVCRFCQRELGAGFVNAKIESEDRTKLYR